MELERYGMINLKIDHLILPIFYHDLNQEHNHYMFSFLRKKCEKHITFQLQLDIIKCFLSNLCNIYMIHTHALLLIIKCMGVYHTCWHKNLHNLWLMEVYNYILVEIWLLIQGVLQLSVIVKYQFRIYSCHSNKFPKIITW